MLTSNKRIILHAGDYCFDKSGAHMHTLLGSCVSITLWHPQKRIGGMCHYALPTRFERNDDRLNPRFGDDCMELFKRSAKRHHTALSEYQAKVFGGGNMYKKVKRNPIDDVERQPVGEKNVAAAFTLLMAEGLEIQVAHVGEFGYRRIIFDVDSGDVWVKFQPLNKMGDQRSLSCTS